jgi:hypothetical protein
MTEERQPTTRREAVIEVIGVSLLVGGTAGFGPLGTILFKVLETPYLPVATLAAVVCTVGCAMVMLYMDYAGRRLIFGAGDGDAERDDGGDGSAAGS